MIFLSVNLLFLMSAILLVGGLLYLRLVRLEGSSSDYLFMFSLVDGQSKYLSDLVIATSVFGGVFID